MHRSISRWKILSLYWNSLPFRGGSVASLPMHCKRRVFDAFLESSSRLPFSQSNDCPLRLQRIGENFSVEMLSLYWNSVPFRGGSIVSIHCKRRVVVRSEFTYSRMFSWVVFVKVQYGIGYAGRWLRGVHTSLTPEIRSIFDRVAECGLQTRRWN